MVGGSNETVRVGEGDEIADSEGVEEAVGLVESEDGSPSGAEARVAGAAGSVWIGSIGVSGKEVCGLIN